MSDLYDRYLSEHAKKHKKPRSVELDRDLIKRFIRPRLGPTKVLALDREDVGRLHRALAATPYQANHTIALPSKMLNLVERWGLRPDGSNPCRHVDRFPQKPRERFLSNVEVAQLTVTLSEADRDQTTDSAIIAAIRLLMLTGARLSEIITLRWDYVDILNCRLRLPDSKTGAKTIHLSPTALKVLAGISRVADNPFVITGAKPGTHLVNLEKPWRRFRDKTTVRLWAQSADERISALAVRLTRALAGC